MCYKIFLSILFSEKLFRLYNNYADLKTVIALAKVSAKENKTVCRLNGVIACLLSSLSSFICYRTESYGGLKKI